MTTATVTSEKSGPMTISLTAPTTALKCQQCVNGTKQNLTKQPSSLVKSSATCFTSKCHPLRDQVKQRTDAWVLENWEFPNEKARVKFSKADFSALACMCFPGALDDRIDHAARLFSLLFLIDDILEHPSFQDGEGYIERLLRMMQGDARPCPTKPAERMMFDLFNNMRQCDRVLTTSVVEGTWACLKATVMQRQTKFSSFGHYLEWREDDIGLPMMCALLRFVMNFKLPRDELASVAAIEKNISRQACVVNDICSWEKEVAEMKKNSAGAYTDVKLCSAVQVLGDETGLDVATTKGILWSMVRAWENQHVKLVKIRLAQPQKCSEMLKYYMNSFEPIFAGHERWTRATTRYGGEGLA